MKKIILIILGVIILIGISFSLKNSNTKGGLLGGSDFISSYNSNPNAVLIDVRTPLEFGVSHIDGAINIDFENPSFQNEINKLDKTKDYFIYCRSGNRSSKSSVIMENSGIKTVYDLKGGISLNPNLLNR